MIPLVFVLMVIIAAVVFTEDGPVYWHVVFTGYRSEHDD